MAGRRARLRPYNPEGISFVHEVHLDEARRAWWIDGRRATFAEPVERHHGSTYRAGDVLIHLADRGDEPSAICDVGMATAAAMFRLEARLTRTVAVEVPLEIKSDSITVGWPEALAGHCLLELPDQRCARLYEQVLHALVLHTPGDVYAGPYTHKRCWFRDAAFILHALLCAGLFDRVERVIDRFPERQARDGFFRSQEGEWNANGEVLWLIERYCALSGRAPKEAWREAVEKGATWLRKKRMPEDGSPHAGLLPAGFSAEHLGPNDYYYWDDCWGIAGLEAAASLMHRYGSSQQAKAFTAEAARLRGALERSLEHVRRRLAAPAMPASPYRRMDSGAVGSLAAGYPLQLFRPDDPRLLGTAEFLLDTCLLHGALFHDVTHSGINAYLTLHLAQVLMRASDPRHADLGRAVARLASPTGQWPEAIHPWTGGGCMGDGQHAWAAAEWMMMIRNAFVREEDGRLVVAAGLWPEWLDVGALLRFGPAPTGFGTVDLRIEVAADAVEVTWSGTWRDALPPVEVAVPGCAPQRLNGGVGRAVVERARCAS